MQIYLDYSANNAPRKKRYRGDAITILTINGAILPASISGRKASLAIEQARR